MSQEDELCCGQLSCCRTHVNCRLVPKETGVKGAPNITVSALTYDEREWDMATDSR